MASEEQKKEAVPSPELDGLRVIYAILLLIIVVSLSAIVAMWLREWVPFVIITLLTTGIAYLYVYEPEKFRDFYEKGGVGFRVGFKGLREIKDNIFEFYSPYMVMPPDTRNENTYTRIFTETDKTYRKVLTIKTPSTTKWDTDQAHRLMSQLGAIGVPLNFIIRATEYEVSWSIEVGEDSEISAINALQSVYPTASIDASSKKTIDTGFYRFEYGMGAPQLAPLTLVSECKKFDPLSSIVSAMTNLSTDEEVVYELILEPTKHDYGKLAKSFLTVSKTSWADYLSSQGRTETVVRKVMGADRRERFAPEITEVIKNKMMSLLFDGHWFIKIKAEGRERTFDLLAQIMPTIAVFSTPDFNYPEFAASDVFPLLLTPAEAAAIWHLPTQDIKSQGVNWVTGILTPLPTLLIKTVKSKVSDSIVLGTNTYQGRKEEVRLPYADRVTHANLIGGTRVGKSTLMHQMIHQEIQNGKGIALIDPHGDLVNAVLASSIPVHRLNDVVLFDITDNEYPIGLNMLSQENGVSSDKTAGFVLAVIRKMFAESWSASRMEDVLYASIMSLYNYPQSTILDIPRLLLNHDFRRQVTRKVTDPVAKSYWYEEFEPQSDAQKLMIAQPINSRLRKFFRDPGLRRILCQNGSLNFRQLMDQKKIFLANLAGFGKLESETLGALLMSKIQMAAMSRQSLPLESRVPYYLYVDEVQNFVSTSLSVMLSEVGKYGLSLTIANQYFGQLEGDTASAVLANVGTKVIFRVGSEDAPMLARITAPVANAETLQNLDRFNAIVKMQLDGQTLPAFSMMTLPPIPPQAQNDETTAHIRNHSRQKYGRPAEDIDREINERYTYDSATSGPEDEPIDEKSSKGFLG